MSDSSRRKYCNPENQVEPGFDQEKNLSVGPKKEPLSVGPREGPRVDSAEIRVAELRSRGDSDKQ